MELHFRAEKEKLEAQIADRDRQIAHLKKVIEYDVEEIKILKDRLVALGGDPDCGLGARLLAQTAMPDRYNRPRKRIV
mgnify:CR=1 FL=1